MAASVKKTMEDECDLELEDMVIDARQVTQKTTKQKKRILWTLLLLMLIASISTVVWISRHSSQNDLNEKESILMDDYDDNDGKQPQLRSYTSRDKFGEADDIGYTNIFIRKDAHDRRRQPERFRFPAARYNRRRIPVNGPFFHFMPQIPIFADRLTKQTLIFSVSGGVYILPPLVNTYGKLFSVAELIVSGYASLVSSGSLPTGPINMLPFFHPTPLIGPNIPVLRPRHGGFQGGLRTKVESLSIPKDYYKSSNLRSKINMYEDDSEDDDRSYDDDDDDDDYYPRRRSYDDSYERKSSKSPSNSNNDNEIQKKLKQTVLNLFKTFQQGICVDVILNSTVREKYISKNCIGRVQPLGTYGTTELAVEYLYGILCALPNLPTRINLYESVDLLQLTYDSNYYRTSFKVQVNLVSKKKLIFFGLAAFDKDMKLCGYEAIIQNLGLTLDYPIEQRTPIIINMCQLIQKLCPVGSSNQQYTDENDCTTFLSESKTPFGTLDRGDQDNVACRLIHTQLAAISPDIHCPHVGKTGGGACTNKTSESYFEGTSDFVSCAYQYKK